MYVRQWAEGFEGGGVQWGGLVCRDVNSLICFNYSPDTFRFLPDDD